jgi:hypothetical protein
VYIVFVFDYYVIVFAQQLDDYSDRALQLLSKANSTDSTAALRLVNEALSISPFSEALHELKASALILV